MPDPSVREELAQRILEQRKQLGELTALDPRLRELSQSSTRRVLPPVPARPGLSLALFAVLGALALLACVGTATAVVYGSAWLQGVFNDPTTTVQNFYGAVQQGDYARAYTAFSDAARRHTSEAAFAGQFGSYDAIDGTIAAYTLGTPRYASGGNSATLVVTVTRRGTARAGETHTLNLVKQGGQWRIDALTITNAPPTPAAP